MNVGIYANVNRDIGGRATRALFKLLSDESYKVFVSNELKGFDLDATYCDNETLAKNSEIIVVFGGDGTILRIAKECAKFGAKIFAVNLGHKGFLTEVENVELNNIFQEIVNGNIIFDERILLSVRARNLTFFALNEAVIARGSQTRMLKTEVRVNGGLVDRYSSDGIIVSTPTGSTAYSLSAGGPILAPDVDAVIITPICPHSINSRPLVVNNNNIVTVKLVHAESEAHLNIDGDDVLNLFDDDTITVMKSKLKVSFIRLNNYNYYEKLLDKMCYWSSFNKTF